MVSTLRRKKNRGVFMAEGLIVQVAVDSKMKKDYDCNFF